MNADDLRAIADRIAETESRECTVKCYFNFGNKCSLSECTDMSELVPEQEQPLDI